MSESSRSPGKSRPQMSSSYVEELFGLGGQVAVVIGGTGVLGGALCEGLARAGAMVVVAGISAPQGDSRVARIKQFGARAEFLPVDVTSRQSISDLLASTLAAHG